MVKAENIELENEDSITGKRCTTENEMGRSGVHTEG
jgi:hypothetical protein